MNFDVIILGGGAAGLMCAIRAGQRGRKVLLLDHDGPAIDRHSPMLGEHSEEVLRELGYSPAAIQALVAEGVTKIAARETKIAAAE